MLQVGFKDPSRLGVRGPSFVCLLASTSPHFPQVPLKGQALAGIVSGWWWGTHGSRPLHPVRNSNEGQMKPQQNGSQEPCRCDSCIVSL